ncbi:hypothetical protein LY632_09050 [Erythrobacter sp. SDW2]|uniref:hypothetical protein n=1 Tax=Erythrobacter sp. SDW2 TaxID=2907154 RepID=UPI001F1B2627|nr:hypothetical protein [Erythrobacter sp. SDW2]UIP05854.1 hypothetical protein LY632_09050 [Erythrobacter sp. SDW2]
MAVPVRAIEERRIAEHFLALDAVSAADAVEYDPKRPSRKRAFARLKGSDVIRPAGRDRWYLDEDRWDKRRGFRRSRIAGAVFLAAAVGLFAALRSR